MRFIVYLLASLLLLSLVAGALPASSDVDSYTTFDSDDWSDLTGNGHGINITNGVSSLGIIGDSVTFNGVNTIGEINVSYGAMSAVSFAYWATDNFTQISTDVDFRDTSGNDMFRFYYFHSSGNYIFQRLIDGTLKEYLATPASLGINDGQYHFFVVTWDGTNTVVFVDGVEKDNQSISGTLNFDNADNQEIGHFIGVGRWKKGSIDEFAIYNKALSTSEVVSLYASGAPTTAEQYPFVSPAANPFQVSAIDGWDGSDLPAVNVTVDSVTYQNASGNLVTTALYQNDSSGYDVLFESDIYFPYSKKAWVPSDGNLEQELNQSQIRFLGYNNITGSLVTNINVSINGTTKLDNETFALRALDGYTVELQKDGFFDTSFSLNVSALDNYTYDFYGLYDVQFTVVPRDIINNNTISSANITLSNSTYAYSQTASGVENATFNITGGRYLLEIVAPGRVSYAENVTVTVTQNYYAYMYAYNSLWVYAYSQDTGSPILVFNVTVENANASYNEMGSGGVARFDNITSGSYTVTVSAASFSDASYAVVVTDNSFQELDAFLTAASDTFIFVVKDKSTNGLIEGATITQRRFINSSLVTIESKDTDITGRVQFTYTPGVEYTFIATNDGYISKTFLLEILFDTYNLLLTPTTFTNETVYLDDVLITNNGYSFVNGSSWVAYTVSSPLGSLETFWLNITLNNGSSVQSSVSSATGGYINLSIPTPTAVFGDQAIVRLIYKSTLNAGNKTLQTIYSFSNWNPQAGSSIALKNAFSGYSDLEKVFWSTVVALLLMGVFGFVGLILGEPLVFGAVGGIIAFAGAIMIGTIHWVAAGIVIFILVLLIVGRLISSG